MLKINNLTAFAIAATLGLSLTGSPARADGGSPEGERQQQFSSDFDPGTRFVGDGGFHDLRPPAACNDPGGDPFRPVAALPEPSVMAEAGIAAFAWLGYWLRRRWKAASA